MGFLVVICKTAPLTITSIPSLGREKLRISCPLTTECSVSSSGKKGSDKTCTKVVSGNLDGSDDGSQKELLELAVHRNFMGPGEISGLECVEGLGFNPSRCVVPKLPRPSLSITLC